MDNNKEKQMKQINYVQISPLKEWSIRVKVKSIEKAKPNIVEPEEVDYEKCRNNISIWRSVNC